MDFNADSSDLVWPKLEVDSENESPRREPRLNWTSENTIKLIKMMEKDCKELWDVKHPLNKDRFARQAKLDFLADHFGTTSEEISRKIHNLRTQLNKEIRKIKRRQSAGGAEANGVGGSSGWEYFDALSFLMRAPTANDSMTLTSDPQYSIDGVSLELAEFQANEEVEFGAAAVTGPARPQQPPAVVSSYVRKPRPGLRVAASTALPVSSTVWYPEDATPLLLPGTNNPDECQVFGDFVASELRTLRSAESRRRLKRMIQKAILQIEEEEEQNVYKRTYRENGAS